MSRKIVFEPIQFDDDKQKKATQFTTTVGLMKDGKKIYADEVTGFMYQEFSTFAPAKFNDPDKRDWLRIPINEEEKACVDFETIVNEYDDAFETQKDTIFGKFSKLYSQSRSVKEPKEEDELEMEANADKPKKPKLKSIKLKLKMGWNYYYDNQLLDSVNTGAVRKAVSDALAKNNDKNIINDVIVTLKFTDEDGKKSEKKLKMGDIESRKEISTKIYYRKAENVSADAKKPADCSDNDELEAIYGKPEEVTARSPEDLDKYHRANCYVRYLFGPSKVWAAKAKGEDGKRRTSLQFVCHQIDIIHLRNNTNTNSTVRSIYSGYGFGSRPESVFNAGTNATPVKKEKEPEPKAESESESESEEETKPVAKAKATPAPAPASTKAGKQALKVESESEEEESEEEESESESEDEPEPPKKTKGKTAVVEEKPKAKAAPKKK